MYSQLVNISQTRLQLATNFDIVLIAMKIVSDNGENDSRIADFGACDF